MFNNNGNSLIVKPVFQTEIVGSSPTCHKGCPTYPTLTQAGLALGVSRTAVKKAMDHTKVLKKTYVIKLNKK